MNSSAKELSYGTADVRRSLIFLVEDDGDVAGLISHTLRSGGFDVQSFADGTSVLSEGMRLKPSLFLLDVMLPGTDGFELCRLIRKSPTLGSIPVIFLTGRTGENDRVRGLELGADDYIAKPFSTQ